MKISTFLYDGAEVKTGENRVIGTFPLYIRMGEKEPLHLVDSAVNAQDAIERHKYWVGRVANQLAEERTLAEASATAIEESRKAFEDELINYPPKKGAK